MIIPEVNLTEEDQIRALLEERVQAVRDKNVDGVLALVAPDVLSYDIVNPLRNLGADEVRQRTETWFSSFEGAIGYEVRDLEIAANEDVAFGHCLSRVEGTKTDGNQIVMWWRATLCLRKIDGRWTITHEHSSVPFDPETGKASLDLEP